MGRLVCRAARALRKIAKNESGATAIEYGLIAVLISIVVIGWASSMGESLNERFSNLGTTIGG